LKGDSCKRLAIGIELSNPAVLLQKPASGGYAVPRTAMLCRNFSHLCEERPLPVVDTVYRERATFYTDQYAAYTNVISTTQHKAIPKHARKTNDIERFNITLR
jgi:hypothetical protein